MELRIQTARAFKPLLVDARYKAARGGRGSAKSHFFGESLIERCILKPGTRWLCIREHQVSLRNSVKPLLEGKIRKFGAGRVFEELKTEVRTPGGGLIVFTGMKNHTAESIKSYEDFDGAWIEEAQTFSARSWEMLRPTIRKPGSEIWSSWNPRKPDDPIETFFHKDKRPKNSVVVTVTWRDNPWLPDVLREELEYDKRRDPDRYKHVWEGGYDTKSHARVFTNWTIGDADEIDLAVSGLRPRYGQDYGFAVDPTAAVECFIDEKTKTLYITREAWRVGVEVDELPAFFSKHIPNMHSWPARGDSARPDTISYLKRKGFPKLTGAKKGPGSVLEGVQFVKGYNIVVHPRCVHTIDELTLFSYKIDPRTEEVLPELQDEDNHIIDALRYSVEELRRPRAGVF